GPGSPHGEPESLLPQRAIAAKQPRREVSAHLRQRRRDSRRGGGLDERFDELHIQRDVPLVLRVPLDTDDPPAWILTLEGLDQAIGRHCGGPEGGGKLANTLVVIAVDANF